MKQQYNTQQERELFFNLLRNKPMKQWIQSWNMMRLLRLAMGIAILFHGIDLEQWLFVFIEEFTIS